MDVAHASRASKPSQALSAGLDKAAALAQRCMDHLDAARLTISGLAAALRYATRPSAGPSPPSPEALLSGEWALVWGRLSDACASWRELQQGPGHWAAAQNSAGAGTRALAEYVAERERRVRRDAAPSPAGEGGEGRGSEVRVRALGRQATDVDPEEERRAFIHDVYVSPQPSQQPAASADGARRPPTAHHRPAPLGGCGDRLRREGRGRWQSMGPGRDMWPSFPADTA